MSAQLIGLPATDNLYKFLAMSGVALAALSLAYPTQLVDELEFKAADLTAQRSKSEIKKEYLHREIKLIERQQCNESVSSDVSAAMLKAESELRSTESDVKASEEKVKLLISQARFYTRLGYFGAIVGIFMAALGFRLWYIRVQLPADKKTLSESIEKDTSEP